MTVGHAGILKRVILHGFYEKKEHTSYEHRRSRALSVIEFDGNRELVVAIPRVEGSHKAMHTAWRAVV